MSDLLACSPACFLACFLACCACLLRLHSLHASFALLISVNIMKISTYSVVQAENGKLFFVAKAIQLAKIIGKVGN